MANQKLTGSRIAGVVTCVPAKRFDNLNDTTAFTKAEVKKVVGMAGVNARRMSGDSICSSDLCAKAAQKALDLLSWQPDSVDALIMITQSPDYFLPSTACVVQNRLGLSDGCACFDVGLGCSGYPYGLWLASMMIASGMRRVLVLHGETPTRFSEASDRSVSLLFGDAGSATAVEASGESREWCFVLHSDGSGGEDMIIEAGGFRDRFNTDRRRHFVFMNGQNIFNFTIKRVPQLISDTLDLWHKSTSEVDYFVFHQSNRFIMKHILKKTGIPEAKAPMVIGEYGNTGGPSIPLAVTLGDITRSERPLAMMLLGYGVGLSWGSAGIYLDRDAVLHHIELDSEGYSHGSETVS